MRRSTVYLLTFLAVTLGSSPDARAIAMFADDDFADADWSAVVFSDTTGTFSFVAQQSTATGNPAPSRFIRHETSTGPAQVALGHLFLPGVYDPSTQGAIDTIELEIEAMVTDGGPSGAVGYGLMVMQGGVLGAGAGLGILEGTGWNSISLTYTAADLPTLDLSSAGAPITLGFFSSNGTSGGSGIFSESFVDGLRVSVTPIPEPATSFLLAAGLLGIGMGRRRPGAGSAR